MWRLSLLLLLLPCFASASISLIATATHASSSATTRTPGEPAGTEPNDFVLMVCSYKTSGGAPWTAPTDFTEIDSLDLNEGDNWSVYIGYKIRGATSGEAYTCSQSGTAAAMRGTTVTFRGVDTSVPIDLTYVRATHQNSYDGDGGLSAAQAITTATDGAWVVLWQYFTDDGAYTTGVPSGFTLVFEGALANAAHTIARFEDVSAGVVTPGVWTHTDVLAGADSSNFTIALRPADTSALLLRRRRD